MPMRRKDKLLLCLSICRQVAKHFGHRKVQEVLFLPVLVKHSVLFLCFGTRRKIKRLLIGILVRCAFSVICQYFLQCLFVPFEFN